MIDLLITSDNYSVIIDNTLNFRFECFLLFLKNYYFLIPVTNNPCSSYTKLYNTAAGYFHS